MMKCTIVALLVVLCVVLTAAQMPRIGIFFADSGSYSGTSEAHYILLKLTEAKNETVQHCESAVSGLLPGHDGALLGAALFTTGIGEVNTALCTSSAFAQFTFTKVIMIGTSGISPVWGGLNPTKPGGCAFGASVLTQPLAIGSMCITSTAYNMACGLCTYNDSLALPDECSQPHCEEPDNKHIFGPCVHSAPDRSLEEALEAVAANITLPPLPGIVQEGIAAYWAAVGRNPPKTPSIVTTCAEADLRQIYASGPMEFMCRERAARYLSAVEGTDKGPITPDNTPCFAAMEGIGFLHVAVPHSATTQVAIVRGASNYAVFPLKLAEGKTCDGRVRWVQQPDYMPAKELDEFIKAGYMYSISTTNAVVLQYLATLDKT